MRTVNEILGEANNLFGSSVANNYLRGQKFSLKEISASLTVHNVYCAEFHAIMHRETTALTVQPVVDTIAIALLCRSNYFTGCLVPTENRVHAIQDLRQWG